MKKILLLLNLLLITLLMLTGCSLKSKTPSPEQILADYNARYSDTSYANFNKIEVVSENDNDSLYIASVVLKGEDDYAEYTLETSIYYSFNDEAGWTFSERRSSQVEYTLVRGRSEEDIKEWISQNEKQCIPNSRDITDLDITYLGSSFYENGTQTVNIKWTEQRFDVYGECEGELDFYYKKGYGWEYHGTKTTSEKYKILNMENTVWRYEKINRYAKNLEPVYHDFTIKSISDDGMCLTGEYDGKTYVGYAKEDEFVKDGKATYYFPEDGLLRSAILKYASNIYFDDEDYYLKLDIDIPGGGYFDFVRIDK